MCGIFAVKGKDAIVTAYEGLKKLEYRGYDSCGIGFKDSKGIRVFKSVGFVEKLADTKVLEEKGNIAIAHTRWATTGGVTIENSHPHLSASGRFAVVHNGIIENYQELKKEYLSDITFTSETDTEVIVQLMDKFASDNDIFSAFKKVVACLQGSYAIVLIVSDSETIYFARKSSPMVLAKAGSKYMISSDINGLENKRNVFFVPDNSIGYIGNKVILFDNNSNKIKVKWENYSNDLARVDMAGYPHFMIKEIMEIPNSLRRSYESFASGIFKLPKRIDNVLIVACGTSYHSGLMGSKYIEKYSGKKCECIIASEFIYNDYIVRDNTIAIFISQSGETADTIKAIHKCKDLGLFTLAITNVVGSSISRLVDSCIYEAVGAEICVASTKAYTSQVLMLLLFSNVLINLDKGNYRATNENKYVYYNSNLTYNYLDFDKREMENLFDFDVSNIECNVDKVISNLYDCEQIFLIGKDFDYITAMEGALKIKEVSYIFTDDYPCGELKHGTLALIEDGRVVIPIITSDKLKSKSMNSISEVCARGGKCVVITQLDDAEFCDNLVIKLPKLCDALMPIISIVPIDIIAYKLSTHRGYNPDKPRNLAKSVTVE